ncbi:MAG: type II toxin-antitoxin system MqsA family antitoxin [Deltaproteobacteria bacterium]|nr:type II toxin-antitoxin system MqsA family antitoxin [Deltaproteobacteria bacterium]
MNSAELCPLRGGRLAEGTTTFTADFGDAVVVARHVPARVCSQCGEAWGDDAHAARLEAQLQQAKASGKPVEVIDLAA